MKIEIVSTGNEIMSGSVLDTNASYIAKKFQEEGLWVSRKTSISDDLEDLIKVFEEVSSRADVSIVTGGLGPTSDDLTAVAISKVTKKELVLNNLALKNLEEYFSKIKDGKAKLVEQNKKQAFLPLGSEVIPNTKGTAPGFALKHQNCKFFFLPGVPYEMKEMFESHIMPLFKNKSGGLKLFETLSTFGVGESNLSQKLKNLESEFFDIKIGYRFVFPTVDINLYAKTNQNVKTLKEKIKAHLGNRIFSEKRLSLSEEVSLLLKKKKKTIALAESCTGGLIANIFTDISGSSDFFLFSGVTYSNFAKMKFLDVKKETIEKYGAISEETAKEMAKGVQKKTNADYGISISGIAGPKGGSEEKPVGTFAIALAGKKGICFSKKFCSNFDDRMKNKNFFAFKAIDILRLKLLDEEFL